MYNTSRKLRFESKSPIDKLKLKFRLYLYDAQSSLIDKLEKTRLKNKAFEKPDSIIFVLAYSETNLWDQR